MSNSLRQVREFVDNHYAGRAEKSVEYAGNCHVIRMSPREASSISLHFSISEAKKFADKIMRLVHLTEHGEEIAANKRRSYRSVCIPTDEIMITGHPESNEVTILARSHKRH